MLLATLLFAGCATKRDFRDLSAQLQSQELARQEAMAQIEQLILALSDTTRAQSVQLVEARADLMRELLEVRDQLVQVQERTGLNSQRLAELRDDIQTSRETIDVPRGELGGTPPSSEQAEEDFNAAQSAYDRDPASAAARRGFEQFIRQYPDDARAPDAHYQLANILLEAESSDAALGQLSLIPQRYPTSSRVPEALYRMGTIELDRGNPDAARDHLQRLITNYPDSDVTPLARERLAEIG